MFKIVIENKKIHIKQIDVYTDNLMCVYDYRKNGKNLLNSPQRMGGNVDELESGFTIFTFYDKVNDNLGTAKFEILENGTARWTLKNRTMVHNSDWKEGFSVPTDIILTKIE